MFGNLKTNTGEVVKLEKNSSYITFTNWDSNEDLSYKKIIGYLPVNTSPWYWNFKSLNEWTIYANSLNGTIQDQTQVNTFLINTIYKEFRTNVSGSLEIVVDTSINKLLYYNAHGSFVDSKEYSSIEIVTSNNFLRLRLNY